MSDLDKIKARIRALKEKTTAAGCTEAEALAAAEVAARIMAEHGLSDADVIMTSERVQESTSRATWRSHVLGSVQFVTNTAGVLSPGENVEFFGRAPGPEIAVYLYQVLCHAVERESTLFKETQEYRKRRTVKTKRAALNDFRTAMTIRLRGRLKELFKGSLNEAERAQARQAMTVQYPGTTPLSAKARRPRFDGAVSAGWAAGGRTTLVHGVAGKDGKPLAIGGAS